MDIKKLLRPNILTLKAYSSAREEYQGQADVLLDANENPYESAFNRYPDPLQRALKAKIAELKGVSSENIFLGNGSDEAIDLLIRAFCEPKEDSILQLDPSYGMYRVSADINDVEVIKVPLTADFELEAWSVLRAVSPNTKIIFICSPNNPSGNVLDHVEILKITRKFEGIVVIDEAYIDFSRDESFLEYLSQHKNLIVMQTFSKAWGLAGIRLGMAFAHEEIIAVLNKVKPPYNINSLTQEVALKALANKKQKEQWVGAILDERKKLEARLKELPIVERIYPSDTNFLLIRFKDSQELLDYLLEEKVILRNRSKALLCEGCLRITVGTSDENDRLMKEIEKYIAAQQ